MGTLITGESAIAAGSPTAWRHAGGESDGECDACWAELDIDEEAPRSDPHQAAPDAHQLAAGYEGLFCGICGHDVEAVAA